MDDKTAPPSLLSRRGALALGLAALVGAVLLLDPGSAPPYAGGTLSVAEAHRRAATGEVLLIDIRTPDEWRASGVPEGGYPLDIRREDFAVALQDLARRHPGTPVALICATGGRLARLAADLTEAGLTGVLDVPEGMHGSKAGPGWLAEGLPVRAPAADPG